MFTSIQETELTQKNVSIETVLDPPPLSLFLPFDIYQLQQQQQLIQQEKDREVDDLKAAYEEALKQGTRF